ncbi:MAG: carbohydrate kinase [Hyphomicrobiales bacterium]|nr:carbohydrate kinase family protein [Hyphomicrobiales bacterium]PCJ81573.1 MAG: carbohydrate kinase [Hyphomicrobiales bacterium]
MSKTANPGKVVCVGQLYCDLIFGGMEKMPRLGEEVFADSLAVHAGGGAYITGAYLAALGRKVSLVAAIPAEPFGSLVMAEINAKGIDTTHCTPSKPGADPQITVAMAHGGDRAFLTRQSGAVLENDDLGWLNDPELTHLHIGELTTLISHPDLIAKARDTGLTISVDCSWAEESFSHPDVLALLQQIDVFLPNEAEIARLQQANSQTAFATLTVKKRGKRGAEAQCQGETISSSAHLVDVVDTTGAGDAFNAGFLNAWLNGDKTMSCLAAGNTMGAIAVSRLGGATDVGPETVRAFDPMRAVTAEAL